MSLMPYQPSPPQDVRAQLFARFLTKDALEDSLPQVVTEGVSQMRTETADLQVKIVDRSMGIFAKIDELKNTQRAAALDGLMVDILQHMKR